jgi:hypothetical protein
MSRWAAIETDKVLAICWSATKCCFITDILWQCQTITNNGWCFQFLVVLPARGTSSDKRDPLDVQYFYKHIKTSAVFKNLWHPFILLHRQGFPSCSSWSPINQVIYIYNIHLSRIKTALNHCSTFAKVQIYGQGTNHVRWHPSGWNRKCWDLGSVLQPGLY